MPEMREHTHDRWRCAGAVLNSTQRGGRGRTRSRQKRRHTRAHWPLFQKSLGRLRPAGEEEGEGEERRHGDRARGARAGKREGGRRRALSLGELQSERNTRRAGVGKDGGDRKRTCAAADAQWTAARQGPRALSLLDSMQTPQSHPIPVARVPVPEGPLVRAFFAKQSRLGRTSPRPQIQQCRAHWPWPPWQSRVASLSRHRSSDVCAPSRIRHTTLSLQAQVSYLEGQRRADANLKRDLARRIHMLEAALTAERYAQRSAHRPCFVFLSPCVSPSHSPHLRRAPSHGYSAKSRGEAPPKMELSKTAEPAEPRPLQGWWWRTRRIAAPCRLPSVVRCLFSPGAAVRQYHTPRSRAHPAFSSPRFLPRAFLHNPP